jgi:acyl-CoA thioesterase FadM
LNEIKIDLHRSLSRVESHCRDRIAVATLALVGLEERKACPIPDEVRERIRAFEGTAAEL